MHVDHIRKGFTLTQSDFRFDCFTAGGKGGQNVNKVASAVRCTHEPSRATGIARDQRDQPRNKRLAFERCIATAQFKAWAAQKLSEIETGETAEQWAEKQMDPKNLAFQVKDEDGRWVDEKKVVDKADQSG